MNNLPASRHVVAARRLAVGVLLLAFLLPAMVWAQNLPFTAADRADLQHFKLSENVLQRLHAVTSEGRGMHIKKSQLDLRHMHSLQDMADQMVKSDPRIKPLLAKHGFTPRQFLIADMVLVRTATVVRRAASSKQAKAAMQSQLDPANVRFYKNHKAAVDKLVQLETGSPK